MYVEPKTPIAKSDVRLQCSYDAYILVKGFIIVAGQGADAVAIPADRNEKQVISKTCALFTNRVSEICLTKDLDVAMSVHNSI